MMKMGKKWLIIVLCLAMIANMGAMASETCEHKNTTSYPVWTNVIYEQNDNDTHIKKGDMYEVTDCEDCGERLGSTDVRTNATEVESHFFNWDPYCDYCNYENPCTHENKTEYTFFGQDTVYEPYDAKQHWMRGSLYDCVACADCGIELTTTLRNASAEELTNHYFEDGICFYCKYAQGEDACRHENSVADEPFFVEAVYTCIDDKTHQASGVKLTIYRCAVCGEVTDNVEEEATETMEHSSNDEGTACQYCKYQYNQDETAPEPTVEPTPVPTAEPTIAPTIAPTAVPTTVPTIAPTAVPTTVPTIAPTVAPTVAPTAEPTARPVQKPVVNTQQEVQQPEAEKDNEEPAASVQTVVDVTALEEKPVAEAMAEVMVQLEEKAADAAVEIVNLDKVVTAEEKQMLDSLSAREQMFVLLSAIGHEEAVRTLLADEEAGMAFSQEAQDVLESVTQRLNAMSETERADFENMLMENFPVETVEIDGKTYEYFAIDLKITQGGETRMERYGFRYDEEKEEWIFMQMEEKAVEEDTEE